MRVLFDNNVPAPLRYRLPGHQVSTAREMGWQELENGDLLTAAENSGFEVMVTGDKNLSYQQNLAGRTLALVVLSVTSWKVLRSDTSAVTAALNRARTGSFEKIERRHNSLTAYHASSWSSPLDAHKPKVARLPLKGGMARLHAQPMYWTSTRNQALRRVP